MGTYVLKAIICSKFTYEIQICGVSLAWVGGYGDDRWVSAKELRDRKLHQSDVERRAQGLNLRIR